MGHQGPDYGGAELSALGHGKNGPADDGLSQERIQQTLMVPDQKEWAGGRNVLEAASGERASSNSPE
jgi:hypothetical protein